MCDSWKALFAGTLLIVMTSVLDAQEAAEVKTLRLEAAPLIGFRSAVSFPIELTNPSADFVVDASPSFGLAFGVRLHDYDDLVETRWSRQDSYVHSDQITLQPTRERILIDQFHEDFSHEYLLEDLGERAKPFVVASLGATHVSTGANSFTRFSFGIGGGIRFYASRHVYFRLQAEWLPIVIDPHAAFLCGGGCIVHLAATVASQGEVVAGPTFRF